MILSQRRRRKHFHTPSEKTQELRDNSRLPATARVGFPPPSVSLRAMAPSEFPRGRGLRPSGGACSPRGPVLGVWASFGLSPFTPPYSDPEGGQVPCLGVRLCPLLQAWPPHPLGPPSQWPILWRARGPVGALVGSFCGGFVSMAHSSPLLFWLEVPTCGTLRVEERGGLRHLFSRHGRS